MSRAAAPLKAIRRGVFPSVAELNDNPKPFIWTATAEQILGKCKINNETPH